MDVKEDFPMFICSAEVSMASGDARPCHATGPSSSTRSRCMTSVFVAIDLRYLVAARRLDHAGLCDSD